MKTLRSVALGGLSLCSGPAFASDPTGLLSLLVFVGFALPWMVVSVLVFLVLGFRGHYRDAAKAGRHARFGAIGPAVATATLLLDLGLASAGGGSDRVHATDLLGSFAILTVAFALMALPLLFHRLRGRG